MRRPSVAFDEAELDRVPVKPREVVQRTEFLKRALAALAIGLHVIGEHGMGEHRHMAEHVVEDVRLLDVVELVGAADELACGKRRLARWSKKIASGTSDGTATTRQPVAPQLLR